jgi:ACT domain-containing protein
MEKRGPKFRSECPLDLHLRLSEEDREFLNSLGPASAQEKVVTLIHEKKRQKAPLTLLEVQLKIAKLQKEIFRLQDTRDKFKVCLETQFQLSESEIEHAYKQIADTIHADKMVKP